MLSEHSLRSSSFLIDFYQLFDKRKKDGYKFTYYPLGF
jgi:hypothetical protein